MERYLTTFSYLAMTGLALRGETNALKWADQYTGPIDELVNHLKRHPDVVRELVDDLAILYAAYYQSSYARANR